MTGQARDEEEDKEREVGRDVQTVGLRAGEGGDGAYWRVRINNHTGDPG